MIAYGFRITVNGLHQCKFALLIARSRNSMFLADEGELRIFEKA